MGPSRPPPLSWGVRMGWWSWQGLRSVVRTPQERRWGRHPVSYAARSLRLLCEPRREAASGPTVVHPQDEGSGASVGRPKSQGSQGGSTFSRLLPCRSLCWRHRVTRMNGNDASKTQTQETFRSLKQIQVMQKHLELWLESKLQTQVYRKENFTSISWSEMYFYPARCWPGGKL